MKYMTIEVAFEEDSYPRIGGDTKFLGGNITAFQGGKLPESQESLVLQNADLIRERDTYHENMKGAHANTREWREKFQKLEAKHSSLLKLKDRLMKDIKEGKS